MLMSALRQITGTTRKVTKCANILVSTKNIGNEKTVVSDIFICENSLDETIKNDEGDERTLFKEFFLDTMEHKYLLNHLLQFHTSTFF